MTKLTIDDIREQLQPLDNTDLSNTIVNQLTDAEKQKEELEAAKKELNDEVDRLRKENGVLLIRVAAANTAPLDDNTIDEEAIVKDFSTR
ncbi:MAG: hypothetical protein [Bacteriophage sp.]|nr:MAG: hypothetical protein [Bacteriophage sp.]